MQEQLSYVKYPLPQVNKSCMRCPELVKSRKRITFGYGSIHSKVMFYGEAPGRYGCDITGIPFLGDKSGNFFQLMLSKVNWTKDMVYVSNIVKCCPPNNREPTLEEITNCNEYLQFEIDVIKPLVIVCMGKPAVRVILKKTFNSIINLWDRTYFINGVTYVVLPHPAFVVRNRKQWESSYIESFQKIKKLVEERGLVQ